MRKIWNVMVVAIVALGLGLAVVGCSSPTNYKDKMSGEKMSGEKMGGEKMDSGKMGDQMSDKMDNGKMGSEKKDKM